VRREGGKSPGAVLLAVFNLDLVDSIQRFGKHNDALGFGQMWREDYKSLNAIIEREKLRPM
jgi:hypothetical protein